MKIVTHDLLGTSESNVLNAISAMRQLVVNFNVADQNGDTALHRLVDSFNGDLQQTAGRIKALIKEGADLNQKNNQGETPLKLAMNQDVANFILCQPECQPVFYNAGQSITIDFSNFKRNYRSYYDYCNEHGGFAAAVSRYERAELTNSLDTVQSTTASAGNVGSARVRKI